VTLITTCNISLKTCLLTFVAFQKRYSRRWFWRNYRVFFFASCRLSLTWCFYLFLRLFYSIVQKWFKRISPKFTTFLGFSTKKCHILDGSKFSTKSHDTSLSLLFTAMQIFKQIVWNEKWLWIFERKIMLFDKWLWAYEQNYALYYLCSNIQKHFVDDNLWPCTGKQG